MESSMPRIVWEGDRFGSHDTREDLVQSVIGMADHGVPVSVWPAPIPDIPACESDRLALARLAHLSAEPPDDGARISILQVEPYLLRRDESAAYCIGRTAVGTARVSPECRCAADSLDEIWVPSTFSRMAFTASGVPEEKVHVVPTCIDEESFRPTEEPQVVDRGKGFVFSTTLDWDYVRGLDIVLEAYVREFRAEEDVVLALMAPPPLGAATVYTEKAAGLEFWLELENWLLGRLRARGGTGGQSGGFEDVLAAAGSDALREELGRDRERENKTVAEITEAVREELGAARMPAIKVVSAAFPRSILPRLYAACDAFVSAPRAEQWGRHFLEAMAVGVPTIGTRWGGHLDFMRPGNSFLIGVRSLVDVNDGGDPQLVGQRLAEPDVEHLRELMRRVFEHNSEARERAARGAAYVRSKYSRRRVSSLMAERLAEIAGDRELNIPAAA